MSTHTNYAYKFVCILIFNILGHILPPRSATNLMTVWLSLFQPISYNNFSLSVLVVGVAESFFLNQGQNLMWKIILHYKIVSFEHFRIFIGTDLRAVLMLVSTQYWLWCPFHLSLLFFIRCTTLLALDMRSVLHFYYQLFCSPLLSNIISTRHTHQLQQTSLIKLLEMWPCQVVISPRK